MIYLYMVHIIGKIIDTRIIHTTLIDITLGTMLDFIWLLTILIL